MWNRVAKWSRRHVAIVWAAVLILLATTVVSAVSGFLIINAYGRESAQRRRAEAEREHAEAERGQAEANLKKAREAVYAGLIHYGPRDPSAVAELIRVCDALMGMGASKGNPTRKLGENCRHWRERKLRSNCSHWRERLRSAIPKTS